MTGIGHNNPPDPIDEALAPFADFIAESDNWLDGTIVENEGQMKVVDDLIKGIRSAKSEVKKARDAATAPLNKAWKDEVARWKPTEDDIARRLGILAKSVDAFKSKLAAEKEAAKRAAYEEARRKEAEARAAAEKANALDYEAQVEADRLQREAIDAKKAASAANKDKVKGLRTVTEYEITDHRALLNFIAKNHRDDMTKFIEDWARRNHKTVTAPGLKVWEVKKAY